MQLVIHEDMHILVCMCMVWFEEDIMVMRCPKCR
jgi:hypothetical protein